MIPPPTAWFGAYFRSWGKSVQRSQEPASNGLGVTARLMGQKKQEEYDSSEVTQRNERPGNVHNVFR